MFCQNCGRELKDEDKFCPACGTPATVSTEKETVEIPVEEQTFQEVPADEMERVAEENSERFEKREPVYYATPQQRYKKNTGILAGIIAVVGIVVIIALLAGVFVTAKKARNGLKNSTYTYKNELPDDSMDDDDWNFDDDFNFGSENNSDDNLGDFF